jgi:hypothetical protein
LKKTLGQINLYLRKIALIFEVVRSGISLKFSKKCEVWGNAVIREHEKFKMIVNYVNFESLRMIQVWVCFFFIICNLIKFLLLT